MRLLPPPKHHKMTEEQQMRTDKIMKWIKQNKTKRQLRIETGINETTIHSWYERSTKPSLPLLRKLESVYGNYIGG